MSVKSTFIYLFFLGCLSPLGMEDGRIKDSQLKATSYRNGLVAPKYARLNQSEGHGGWCPNQAPFVNDTGPIYTQFIQVKLKASVRIKAITLQGRAGGVEKVNHYWINYRFSDVSYWIYDESSHVKVRNLKITCTNFWQLFLFCP